MFDKLSEKDISNALDDLSSTLGFKEEVAVEPFLALMRREDTQRCVQEIALWLGLPVQIDLSYVSKDFKAGDPNRFHSDQLSKTDWTGRGIEGITAQVAIPKYMPTYGTKALEGYHIRVRVSENCHEQPATFIAIMAHELSHVLLYSLLHPQRDSELHTDLVPVLLGFSDIVGTGRKVAKLSTKGNTTTQHTTTYGYLTDSQFQFASDTVKTAVAGHSSEKNSLREQTAQIHLKLRIARRRLARFRKYLQHIDKNPKAAVKPGHAPKLVECHGLSYTREWEIAIEQTEGVLHEVEGFIEPLNHYTSRAVERLNQYPHTLKLTSKQVDDLVSVITSDLRVLRKYVGPIRKLLSVLFQ